MTSPQQDNSAEQRQFVSGAEVLGSEHVRTFAPWPTNQRSPTRGDIWWSAASYKGPASYEELDRMAFVVLDHFEEAEEKWVDAAPIWHDVDLANDMDLVFEVKHTSLESPLRVQLRREVTLAYAQFEEKLGEVRREGMELIDAALAGNADLDVFGTAYDGPDDWRLLEDTWAPRLVEKLQGPYFATLDRVAKAVSEGDPEQKMEVAPLVVALRARLVDLPRSADHEFALAAATGPRRKVIRLEMEEPTFAADLRAELMRGVLEVEIREVAASWLGQLELLIGLNDGSQVASPPFRPKKGETITFGEGRAVTPGRIDLAAIEAHILRP
jgi:hypothetical protein